MSTDFLLTGSSSIYLFHYYHYDIHLFDFHHYGIYLFQSIHLRKAFSACMKQYEVQGYLY